MKKWSAVVLIFCGTLTAHAQIQLGVKAGLNNAALTSNDFIGGAIVKFSYGSRLGFNGGLMASIPISKSISLQPEAIFSGQGRTMTRGPVETTVTCNYLNIPLLFKIQDASGLFGETGPQVGFLLNSFQEAKGITTDITGLQTTDFSWVFGAGFKIPDSPIGFDVRYNLGFTNINPPTASTYAKNSVFQIDVFFLFKTK